MTSCGSGGGGGSGHKTKSMHTTSLGDYALLLILIIFLIASHIISFSLLMAVASGPAGPVLAGPVFEIVFGIAHAQNSNNVRKSKNNDHTCTSKSLLATSCAAL